MLESFQSFVRNPRQAATIFSLDGNTAPRKRSAFFIRFCRADAGQTKSGWLDRLGFVVKSVDRPSVHLDVEVLNQYNKKRQIMTGYKVQPMRITLYDTADSMAMSMWNEYTKWHFGDFNQGDDTNFRYDVTTEEFKGENTGGFGYVPRPSTGNGELNLNSQFFFDRIEVYQVFGREYTRFDLINPKITQFDPDVLDYSEVEISTITMTVVYEAILYKNNGKPVPNKSNVDVEAVFDGEFNGDTIDFAGGPTRHNMTTNGTSVSKMDTDDFRLNRPFRLDSLTLDSGNSIGSGSLGQFGNFDFGSLKSAVRVAKTVGNVARVARGTAGDVAYISATNHALTSLLNLPSGSPSVTSIENEAFTMAARARGIIETAKLDPIEGALRAAGSVNQYADRYIRNNLVGGVAASSLLNDDSGHDNLTTDHPHGLALNSQSYGLINTQRPSYSQIGFNFTIDPRRAQNGGAQARGQYVPNEEDWHEHWETHRIGPDGTPIPIKNGK